MIEKIEALKKEAITADDDLHDVGWNGAINKVLKVQKAGQHEPIVICRCLITVKKIKEEKKQNSGRLVITKILKRDVRTVGGIEYVSTQMVNTDAKNVLG